MIIFKNAEEPLFQRDMTLYANVSNDYYREC